MAVARYQLAAVKPAEAIKTFETIRAKFPKTQAADAAGVMIGDTWVREQQYDEAVKVYSGLLEGTPAPGPVDALSQRIQRVQQMKAQEQSTTATLKVETTSDSTTAEETPKATENPPSGEGAKKTP